MQRWCLLLMVCVNLALSVRSNATSHIVGMPDMPGERTRPAFGQRAVFCVSATLIFASLAGGIYYALWANPKGHAASATARYSLPNQPDSGPAEQQTLNP